MLLEDLAEETSASNLRTAERLDAEARGLREQQGSVLEEKRLKALESAEQATDYAVTHLPQAEVAWRLAIGALRKNPTAEYAERLLRALLAMFESGQQVVHSPRALWHIAEQLGARVPTLPELDKAEKRFAELIAEAKLALAHRAKPWQPTDPERLALGLQLATEGKTLKSEEARARFRQSPG